MAYDSTIDLGSAVDRDYTRVTSLGPAKIPFVRSFRIRKTSNDRHILTINQNQMIGSYETRDAALGALVGCFHSTGCNEEYALQTIQNQIDTGKSVIEYSQLLELTFGSGAVSAISRTGDEIFHDNTNVLWYNNTNKLTLWYGSLTQGTYLAAQDKWRLKASAQDAYINRFQGTVLPSSTGSFAALGKVSLGNPLTGTTNATEFLSDVALLDFTTAVGILKLEIRTKE